MQRCTLTLAIGALMVALSAIPSPALAQQKPTRTEIWDLQLGRPARDLPDGFSAYACGGNGGPPAMALNGFAEFHRCRAEPGGLREVYFRYDDELEYWAKAHGLATEIEQFSGTKAYGFPVILSALFDEAGVLAGYRFISDARDASRKREDAHALRNFLNARYGREGWVCVDHPPAEGETPVGRTFIKQTCVKQNDGVRLELRTRFFRKAGQSDVDPRSGRETEGQFESHVYFEMRHAR